MKREMKVSTYVTTKGTDVQYVRTDVEYVRYVTQPIFTFFLYILNNLKNIMKTKIFELRSKVSKELEPSLKTKIPDPKRRRRWKETKKALQML